MTEHGGQQSICMHRHVCIDFAGGEKGAHLAGMNMERETMKARMRLVHSASEHSIERLGQTLRLSRLMLEELLRRMCCLRLGVSAAPPPGESKKLAIWPPLRMSCNCSQDATCAG